MTDYQVRSIWWMPTRFNPTLRTVTAKLYFSQAIAPEL